MEHLIAEQSMSQMLKWGFVGVLVFTLLLVGAMTGLTWAVVQALKDTKVRAAYSWQLILILAALARGEHGPSTGPWHA